MENSLHKYVAEALATFGLTFIAAGSVLANWQTGGALGTVGVALAHGLMLAAMIYTVWHISGAHINPAVTIALLATGHIKMAAAAGYIVAQLIGSVVAALLLKTIFVGVSPQFYLGSTMLGNGVTPGMGILVEAVLTFFLVWTVFGAAVDKKAAHPFGGLSIGAVLAVCLLVGGHLTMASLNPARSFGPALVSSYWTNQYVYWVGPILGGLAAGLLYNFGFMKKS